MDHGLGSAGDLSALSPWANELAQTFVSLSSDIALVLDSSGVITSVAQANGEPMAPAAAQWVGRPWVDTVTGDTRRKVELLLRDVASTGLARRREVNHPSSAGAEIPVAYTAVRLGVAGPVLAVGRDLRSIAAIQQRFLDAQQDLERGYWQARQAETRDRLLFQVATDAVLVVDAQSLQIVAANGAATRCLGHDAAVLVGRNLADSFDAHSRNPVGELMVTARGSGRPVEIRARLAGTQAGTSVSATPFRSGDTQRLLVRLRAADAANSAPRPLAAVPGAGADGVAITDSGGRILSCDAAFAALAHAHDESALKGRPLSDWLGDAQEPLVALLADVRRDGLAERRTMVWRNAAAPASELQVSATWLTEGDQESIGIIVRHAAAVAAAPEPAARAALDVWDQLDAQIGESSLHELLREAAVLAEQRFIHLALQRAGGDAAVAARLLGVSRDSLARRRRRSAGGTS